MLGEIARRFYHPKFGGINPYIPHRPTTQQIKFLLIDEEEAFYGGAAGGGKSDAILMASLMYVMEKGYSALILRKSFSDLNLEDALLDRAKKWLIGKKGVRFKPQENCFIFEKSGARLQFGYLQNEQDKYRYLSAAFQFIGFDEVTQFAETQYRFMFSRLRRLEGSNIPLRVRSASNPGNIGHLWVKARFIDPGDFSRPFIPAKLEDNPYLDQVSYKKSLNNLDPITRSRYLKGDWTVTDSGGKFKREWFKIIDEAPKELWACRYWDLAATSPRQGADPDYTAGALIAQDRGLFYLIDMKRIRGSPAEVEKFILNTAITDRLNQESGYYKNVEIYMEEEPGSGGKNTISHYSRNILTGYNFRGNRTSASKEIRANPLSSAIEAGNMMLVKGSWINDFEDEAEVFPYGEHDDQVDAASGAYEMLTRGGGELDVSTMRRPR